MNTKHHHTPGLRRDGAKQGSSSQSVSAAQQQARIVSPKNAHIPSSQSPLAYRHQQQPGYAGHGGSVHANAHYHQGHGLVQGSPTIDHDLVSGASKPGSTANYKTKSMSSGRTKNGAGHQGTAVGGALQQKIGQGGTPSQGSTNAGGVLTLAANSVTPMLQSTQSMSSLSKPFNGNGGRVLISPTNFATVRTGATSGTPNAAQGNGHSQPGNSNGAMPSSLGASHTQLLAGQGSQARRVAAHGSLGKMASHVPISTGSGEVLGAHAQSHHSQQQQQRALEQNSQSYLKQLRKSQILALRQLKKPAGEQLQPAAGGKVERTQTSGGYSTSQHVGQTLQGTNTKSGGSSYPKLSLSDRHVTKANSHKQTGSSDQLLASQALSSQQHPGAQLGSKTTSKQKQAQQPAQLESEYGSLGRQDQKIRFYQSREQHHHPMSRQAASGVAATSNKGSDENSDDFQAVAEEDMGSFILHRNAYLEGEIMTAESQLFKQQPKQGRDPRPNPNTHTGKSQPLATNATGSSGLAYQRGYSSQKQLITGSVVTSQLSHHSGGRQSSQNAHTPMHVDEITSGPSNSSKALTSETKPRRKTSVNPIGLGASNTVNVAPASSSQQMQAKSGRKSQVAAFQSKNGPLKPQINTLAGGPRETHVAGRALTTLAAPASSSLQQPLFNQQVHEQPGGVNVLSQSEQKRRGAKGLQRVETLTSMGMTKPSYPMFPLEDNKKAMIQFEMNLLARQNKQAAASYSLRQQQSDSQPGTTLLNKATLCDSTNSKQNSSQSAFLRKSLWLLTSLKCKALKEVVNAQQPNCQACHYLRRQGVGCLVQNPNLHAAGAIQTPTINHAQTFIYNQNDSQGNVTSGLGGSILIKNNNSTSSTTNLATGTTNIAQSVVVTLPEKPQLKGTKKDGSQGVYSRQQQVAKRHSQKQSQRSVGGPICLGGATMGGLSLKHQSALIDKTHGAVSSQGVNWLGSMAGTQQILLVETYEHDYWKLLTQKTLNTKYLTSQEYYNSKIAADIMYNEQRHIVSVFKEYLIFDDFSEYLKRFYAFKEAQDRLPRVFEFYEHYSKVFPNYVSVPESKYMFKNIERKQKLIDQRHQIYMKNQAAKEGADGKAGNFKHSANMLFGSQFLKEVYSDDTHTITRADLEKRVDLKAARPAPSTSQVFESPVCPDGHLRRRLAEAGSSQVISPQAKQAMHARQISQSNSKIIDASVARHQGELENVISMLSKFEQSRRAEESMSVTISRSYIDGSESLHKNTTKQTPIKARPEGVSGVGLNTDASRKNLEANLKEHRDRRRKDKHIASQQDLKTVKNASKLVDPFTDGWNMQEPTHDLSMSSWALTSFLKNGEDQMSGLAGFGSSMVEGVTVGNGGDIQNAFQPSEISIDDFAQIASKLNGEGGDKEPLKAAEAPEVATLVTTKQATKSRKVIAQADIARPGAKLNPTSEVLHQQFNVGSPTNHITSSAKRKTLEHRRNSALGPKTQTSGHQQHDSSSKGLSSLALIHQKSPQLESMTASKGALASQTLIRTSRVDREKIKQTPQRDEKVSIKKKLTTAGTKTGVTTSNINGNNNLANSRCRSKLSIGSSQTQTQQTISKKAAQNHQSSSKKQIEKWIKDSSLKLQMDKNHSGASGAHQRTLVGGKRTGASTTTNQQASKAHGSINQNLAKLVGSSEPPTHAPANTHYNTSQHSITHPTKQGSKSSSTQHLQSQNSQTIPQQQPQPTGGVNSSRNAKLSQGTVKSNSQVQQPTAGSVESQTAYKSSGHIASTVVQGQGGKVTGYKAAGYDDAKGINERFIDLNKASENAPKISKPSLANAVIKSSDLASVKANGRIGDQSAKTSSTTNGQNLLASHHPHHHHHFNHVVVSHNSVRSATGQHSIGFRKSIESPQLGAQGNTASVANVGNSQVSPISSTTAAKLQGHQVKTVQRTYHNRPMAKGDTNQEVTSGSIALHKSPQTKTLTNRQDSGAAGSLLGQSNLPQIFKKDQKSEVKQIRPSAYDIQVKTIYKHEGPNTQTPNSQSVQQFASVGSSQPSQTSQALYNKKKQSPDQSQHQIQFAAQHTSSKSHEPKDRQSKSESAQKHHQPLKDSILNPHLHHGGSTANSVIGHNSQHCLMLAQQNAGGVGQMMNQAQSSGAQSTQTVRLQNKDHKLDGNMLIQNSILQKNSSLIQQQLGNSSVKGNNPYSKTGRILNSLGNQKQSMQSLGHMSSTSGGAGSHHVKAGRNQKLTVKTTTTTHGGGAKGQSSVSSSSSIGSSKISVNSASGAGHKSDNSQIYLKTLSRGHNVGQIGSKATMVIRKTPSGSNSSSSKTAKKVKVTSSATGSTATKTKVKTTGTSKGVAQNPYPAGASHGQTIFSVTMPRQSLQQTMGQGAATRQDRHH